MFDLLHFSSPFQTNLNNTGCGNQKLCVNEPASCDPGSGSCSFFSARQISGENFEFAVAGESDGYVGTVLSSDASLVSFPSLLTDKHNAQWHMDFVVQRGIICINFFCVLFYILQGGNDTTYVCFNNNGTIEFTGAILNNGQLTKQNVLHVLYVLYVLLSF